MEMMISVSSLGMSNGRAVRADDLDPDGWGFDSARPLVGQTHA